MIKKEELEENLKEQVRIYAEFEILCKSELDALNSDKLNVLSGVMKNKAKLIEKLNKLGMKIKNSQNQGYNPVLSIKTDPVLKKYAEEAINKVENVLNLEERTRIISEKQLNELEMELLGIQNESETLGKYTERGNPNARFIDINR